jgi:predicted RNase H-like nuclease (RuvC/YqgF family)
LPQREGAIPQDEAEPLFELAEEPSGRAEAVPHPVELSEPSSDPLDSPQVVHSPQAGSLTSVEKAIEEANAIVDTLRRALDDMEEVLEMLELFERQKNADEREIESLRRALRQMHRPRDPGHHQHR